MCGPCRPPRPPTPAEHPPSQPSGPEMPPPGLGLPMRILADASFDSFVRDGDDAMASRADSSGSTVARRAKLGALLHAVEELGHDEVGASVDLLLQKLQVLLVALCLDVALRVACDADANMIAVLLADELHEVDRVAEPVLALLHSCPTGGSLRSARMF